jgi:hypothetical protein
MYIRVSNGTMGPTMTNGAGICIQVLANLIIRLRDVGLPFQYNGSPTDNRADIKTNVGLRSGYGRTELTKDESKSSMKDIFRHSDQSSDCFVGRC